MISEPEIKRTAVIDAPSSSQGTFEHKVIGGYLLEERIGSGGYGEVWKAIGPGGLPKAVKVLHGRLNGPQAETEMRALEKMRELRHPFLLNIERIDACDGRVIIVTELADGCLEERFQTARQNGLPGIPRDELLGYLRDAAEALDFMNEEHGLQHLDVKPENLLFQGSHVKVGDFGLTKDVRNSNVSLVGGFTPLYAPPELFEGRPSAASDQYSLAIVYQTMLTGRPPFSGRTAAQLTAQHLSSSPDLQELQPIDRPAIARALSKRPSSRFANCREFVAALCRRRSSGATTSPPRKESVRKSSKAVSQSDQSVSAPMTERDSRLEAKPITPTEPSDAGVSYRPTVILGLGGLAGRVLSSVRRHQLASFERESIPAFSMLYIDSDSQAISRTTQDGQSLLPSETLTIPLKDSIAYRKSPHLEWLSRRWLFNIPRSQQVEGIRPLGRLAFVDHLKLIRSRVSEVIDQALNEEALRATQDSTGLDFEPGAVDVVIVASTSGGVGSGAVLDLAYLVRELLAEHGADSSRINGLLVHATGRSSELIQVQQANSICSLRELIHFSTRGLTYESGFATSEKTEQSAPFDDTCLIHIGDELTDQEFNRSADSVADYLHMATLTSARGTLNHWRTTSAGDATKSSGPNLRTIGLSQPDQKTLALAKQLCRAAALHWSDRKHAVVEIPASAGGNPKEAAETLLRELRLTAEGLPELVSATLEGDIARAMNQCFAHLWDALPKTTDTGALPVDALLQELAHAVVRECKSPETEASGLIRDIRKSIVRITDDAEVRIRNAFASEFSSSLNNSSALQILAATGTSLESLITTCNQLVNQFENDHRRLRSSRPSDSRSAGNDDPVRSHCRHSFLLQMYKAVYQLFVERIRQIRDTSRQMCLALISDRCRTWLALAEGFDAAEEETDTDSIPLQAVTAFGRHLEAAADSRLSASIACGDSDAAGNTLVTHAVDFLLTLSDVSEPDADQPQPFPRNAAPVLNNVGGGRRVLAVSSGPLETHWQRKLVEVFGNCVSVCETGDSFKVLCEVDGIDPEVVVSQWKRVNPRLERLATQVHTRIDIDW